MRILELFHQRYSRSIPDIKWPDYVSNEQVLKRASLPSIESNFLRVQLRWAGHITRMGDVRMSNVVFFSEFRKGKRDRGAPRPAEETACTGGNQQSVMAVGSLRPRQFALISEKSHSQVRGRDA